MKSRHTILDPGTNFNCSKWASISHLTFYFFLEIVWSEKKAFQADFKKKINFHVRNNMFKLQKDYVMLIENNVSNTM